MGESIPFHPKARAWVLVLAGIVALPAGARAADVQADLQNALAAEGFENLLVTEDAKHNAVHIVFENRRYRWEIAGLGVVLAIAAAHCDGRIIATPLFTGIPMARIEVDAADYRAFLRGEKSSKELFSRMVIANSADPVQGETRNLPYGKVDLTFSPGLRVNLVTPAPPGELHGAELRVDPGVYANLWRGLTFDGTYVYPLSTSKPVISRAAGTLNARVGISGYFQAQAGRLAEGLDGFAGQLSHATASGNHLMGVTVAQAGYPGWPRQLSYQAFYSWRPLPVDATITGSVGRFLQGDTGYSLDLVSAFAERNVEFYYTKTSLSKTVGAAFTFPLGSMRQPYPGPVRARFRNAFRFVYTYEKPDMGGGLAVPFLDGYQVALRRWNRAYITGYARQLREAGERWLSAGAAKPGE